MIIPSAKLIRVAVFTAVLSGLVIPAVAVAQSATPTAPPLVLTAQVGEATYVVGQDPSVTITATLPAECAGTSATARFYTRTPGDPTPIAPSRDGLQAEGTAKVADDGAVSIAIPLPSQLAGGPEILSAGISDPSCLDALVLYPGSFQIAVADASENPTGSGTIVIPSAALNASPNNGLGTYAEQVGSLTVSANGTKCTTVSLTGGPAIDADGNARIHIGTPDQPAACHQPNAKLTFVNANGQTLFEKYTFLPGVTQLLENFANEPPATSGTPSATATTAATTTSAPLAPNTGTGAGSTGTSSMWLAVIGSLTATLGFAGAVAVRRRR